MKANIQEAGADVKESGLYLEDGGLRPQSPSPEKMGDSCLKAHLHLSVEAEVIIRERGTEQRDQGEGLQGSLCADEHSPFQ